MKEIKCPHCKKFVDHFDHIGDDPARRCPKCKKEISDKELEEAKVRTEEE